MNFTPNNIEIVGETKRGVRIKIKGTSASSDGQYTNERNASKTITISKYKAEKMREQLDEILDEDGDFDDGGTVIS